MDPSIRINLGFSDPSGATAGLAALMAIFICILDPPSSGGLGDHLPSKIEDLGRFRLGLRRYKK